MGALGSTRGAVGANVGAVGKGQRQWGSAPMEGGIGAAAFRLSPALRSEHSGGRVGAVRCGAVRCGAVQGSPSPSTALRGCGGRSGLRGVTLQFPPPHQQRRLQCEVCTPRWKPGAVRGLGVLQHADRMHGERTPGVGFLAPAARLECSPSAALQQKRQENNRAALGSRQPCGGERCSPAACSAVQSRAVQCSAAQSRPLRSAVALQLQQRHESARAALSWQRVGGAWASLPGAAAVGGVCGGRHAAPAPPPPRRPAAAGSPVAAPSRAGGPGSGRGEPSACAGMGRGCGGAGGERETESGGLRGARGVRAVR